MVHGGNPGVYANSHYNKKVRLSVQSDYSPANHAANPFMSLPQIQLGRARVSRLICGCNPIFGNSHTSKALDREMIDYFTYANIKAMLRDCEAQGVNTFQCVANMFCERLLHEYWNEGGTIQWIGQTDSQQENLIANVRVAARYHPVGLYHHGTRTGNLWRTGRIDELKPLIEEIQSLGVAAGVGAHFPEIIEYCEEKDWGVDFYMASFYNVYKTSTGWRESYVVSGVRTEETYDDADRERMARTIRATGKPCLAFKILGAGRHASTADARRRAFEFAFSHIKPEDAVVVGMFPKHAPQVAENAALVRDLAALSSP